MFEATLFSVAQKFSDAIDPLVKGRESEYNLALGLTDRLIQGSLDSYKPLLLTVHSGPVLVLAAIQTRPLNIVLVGEDTAAAIFLAQFLRAQSRPVEGVVGVPNASKAFAEEWIKLTGSKRMEDLPQVVYELRKVIWPKPTEGQMRYCTKSDLPLLSKWLYDFCVEAIPQDGTTPEEADRMISSKVNEQFAFVWQVQGRPVAMACLARPSRGGVCVNSVYTPPKNRQQGYASQLVASLSHHALSKGYRFCTLYTDLNNPTSNSIYAKIGYRRLADSLMVRWT